MVGVGPIGTTTEDGGTQRRRGDTAIDQGEAERRAGGTADKHRDMRTPGQSVQKVKKVVY